MSKEAQGLLPTLTVSNRVGEMAITGEAELVVKDLSTYGFSWCKTEQLTGTVMHQYHLHAFPFDVHEVALRLPRSLALSRALSRSLALSRALSRSLTLSHAHSSIRRCPPRPGLGLTRARTDLRCPKEFESTPPAYPLTHVTPWPLPVTISSKSRPQLKRRRTLSDGSSRYQTTASAMRMRQFRTTQQKIPGRICPATGESTDESRC